MSEAVTGARPLSEAVAEEIRVAMARRRWRQSDLANALGTNEAWLSRRLAGKTDLSLDDLENIARALGVKVIDLLPDQAARNSPCYEHPGQAAIGRTPDPATRRPRDSRPASRPIGPRAPIPVTGVRRPQRRYATLPDAHLRLDAEKIPA